MCKAQMNPPNVDMATPTKLHFRQQKECRLKARNICREKSDPTNFLQFFRRSFLRDRPSNVTSSYKNVT